jgi:hypothetical protein
MGLVYLTSVTAAFGRQGQCRALLRPKRNVRLHYHNVYVAKTRTLLLFLFVDVKAFIGKVNAGLSRVTGHSSHVQLYPLNIQHNEPQK